MYNHIGILGIHVGITARYTIGYLLGIYGRLIGILTRYTFVRCQNLAGQRLQKPPLAAGERGRKATRTGSSSYAII